MAAAKVFNTAELLEMILLQNVPITDLTRARQINSFFRAVIDNSRALRHALFLEAIPDSDRTELHLHNGVDDGKGGLNFEVPSEVLTITKLHPAIAFSDCEPVDLGTIYVRDSRGIYVGHSSAYMPMDALALDWGPGPWQSMLVFQPPAGDVHLVYVRKSNSGTAVSSECIESDTLTLGSLMKAIEGLGAGNRFLGVKCDELVDERSSYVCEGWMSDDKEEEACEEDVVLGTMGVIGGCFAPIDGLGNWRG